MSNKEEKILSWLYMVEVTGDNRAAENLKQEVPLSLEEWSRRNDLEKLMRSYRENYRRQTPQVDWE